MIRWIALILNVLLFVGYSAIYAFLGLPRGYDLGVALVVLLTPLVNLAYIRSERDQERRLEAQLRQAELRKRLRDLESTGPTRE